MKIINSIALTILVSLLCGGSFAQDNFLVQNRFVPHESTVPANAGQQVGIFLHEKISAKTASELAAGGTVDGRVVLFIHGVSVPTVPGWDLSFKDYSWMSFLAARGYDAFSMDHSGYSFSPQPHMDNPCNLSDAELQSIAKSAQSACEPTFFAELTSSQTDWDEIDSVVDYIRELRGVDRVTLIAWSLGGIRAGGYTARQGDKIDKLVLFAPVYQSAGPSEPRERFPRTMNPVRLQTRDALMNDRWGANVACDNQVEAGVQDAVWNTILEYDRLGRAWMPPEGVMRVRNGSTWGWNKEYATRIDVPTLIMVGEQDGLLAAGRSLYADLTMSNKVLVTMNCATHFANWELSQYRFMQQTALDWLESNRFQNQANGAFRVDYGGELLD